MKKVYFLLLVTLASTVQAQEIKRCAANQLLQQRFEADRNLKTRFEQRRNAFNRTLRSAAYSNEHARAAGSVYVIPVIVHVVLQNPSVVTDAQIMAQLDTLNKSFSGLNGDLGKVPSYFQPVIGKSALQFCLAQRTPDGFPTTGIDRVKTTKTVFSVNDEGVKHASLGGTDSWNTGSYMNIWITDLAGGVLGYSSFPDDESPAEQGVVIDYRSLPGAGLEHYDNGKTLVHESGHFFNLYHIWGDDNGACSGTDYVDDTPNQANSTTGCSTGKLFDNCTTTGNGIMYQNYMDYTQDDCLIMFTSEQVLRMETAAATYFGSLINSDACQPVILLGNNAAIRSIKQPEQRLCGNEVVPVITFQNLGSQVLKKLTIRTVLDNGDSAVHEWTGTLEYRDSAEVDLDAIHVREGHHVLTAHLYRPNGQDDEDDTNDSLSKTFQYFPAVTELTEGFEHADFPAPGWDIKTDESGTAWTRESGNAATGAAATQMKGAPTKRTVSLLRLPELDLRGIDSAWLSFSSTGKIAGLEILGSQDCGLTYTTVYSAPANSANRQAALENGEWLTDSVDLTGYINKGNLLLAFSGSLNDTGSIYLDDVNLRRVTVNPNLKTSGFLVTPNPSSGMISIQFYPEPTDLRSIELFSATGQRIKVISIGQQATSVYTMDLSSLSSGVYIVAAGFSNKRLVKKIIKK